MHPQANTEAAHLGEDHQAEVFGSCIHRDASPVVVEQPRVAVLPKCAKCYSMAGYNAATLKSDILYEVLIYRARRARDVLTVPDGIARTTVAKLELAADLRAK